MPKEVLTNATLLVNSVNLSDHTSSISIEDSAEEVDFTAFSASEYRETGAGLKDATITATLFNDHAAASVADTLQPLYDSGGTFTVRVKPGPATDICAVVTVFGTPDTATRNPPVVAFAGTPVTRPWISQSPSFLKRCAMLIPLTPRATSSSCEKRMTSLPILSSMLPKPPSQSQMLTSFEIADSTVSPILFFIASISSLVGSR